MTARMAIELEVHDCRHAAKTLYEVVLVHLYIPQ
jgi:hypothetical protein